MLFPSKIALTFVKMASHIMPIPPMRHQRAHLGWGKLSAVLLSVVAILAVSAPVATFFRPDNISTWCHVAISSGGPAANNEPDRGDQR
jgi:hypothetical protein